VTGSIQFKEDVRGGKDKRKKERRKFENEGFKK
jgi:hypothetical protein